MISLSYFLLMTLLGKMHFQLLTLDAIKICLQDDLAFFQSSPKKWNSNVNIKRASLTDSYSEIVMSGKHCETLPVSFRYGYE